MKVIIPAKASSERVPNKNWRPFYRDRSLVDLNIEAMLGCGVRASDIHVSCESEDLLMQAHQRYGITPLLRSASLCANSVPLTTWIRTITSQVVGDEPICWSQVCDPLFTEHAKVFSLWSVLGDLHDSLCVVHEGPAYLLDNNFRPMGWGFGEWHVPSQKLPKTYTFPFTMSILTREAIAKTGYHVGARPHFYVAATKSIDIDTEADFAAAQLYMESLDR